MKKMVMHRDGWKPESADALSKLHIIGAKLRQEVTSDNELNGWFLMMLSWIVKSVSFYEL